MSDIALPIIKFLDGDHVELAAHFSSPHFLVGDIYFTCEIDAGFVFDGASIPRALWRLCGHPLESPRIVAALVHDWLYAAHVFTRRIADDVYNQLEKTVGISCIRTGTEWSALRMFGGSAWRSHDETDRVNALHYGYVQPIID